MYSREVDDCSHFVQPDQTSDILVFCFVVTLLFIILSYYFMSLPKTLYKKKKLYWGNTVSAEQDFVTDSF